MKKILLTFFILSILFISGCFYFRIININEIKTVLLRSRIEEIKMLPSLLLMVLGAGIFSSSYILFGILYLLFKSNKPKKMTNDLKTSSIDIPITINTTNNDKMPKKIKTNDEFDFFCNSNNVIFKLPQENSGKNYMLINTYTSESATGLSDSNSKCEQNWELKSSYKDGEGTVILVFEIWANTPFSSLPGSVDYIFEDKTLEISLNQILRVISQFASNNPQDIWHLDKIRNAHILENFT
jgi:hypothetical protein